MPRRIAFISHAASRGGAPILLLNLIEKLRESGQFEMEVFLISGGPMIPDFKKTLLTYFIDDTIAGPLSPSDRILNKVGLGRFSVSRRKQRAVEQRIATADLIFANTVVPVKYLRELQLAKPVYFYIHELSVAVQLLVSREEMAYIATRAAKIFVPAHYLKDFLVKAYAFPEKKVEILKYVIPEKIAVAALPKTVFTVGACAGFYTRKGYDLFAQIAREIIINRSVTNIHFCWIGGRKDVEAYFFFREDLIKSGIDEYVTIIEPTDRVADYLAGLDVFLLPSREDPYPLVVLEAAAQKVPTVYFDQAGGIGEFVGDGGIKVDYLDIPAFATAVLSLKTDQGKLDKCRSVCYANYLREQESLSIDTLVEQFKNIAS